MMDFVSARPLEHIKTFPTPIFPKGGQGCLMSSPCLKSQCCHLIPLYHLFSCSSAYSHCIFCLVFFLPTGPFSWLLSRNFFRIFRSEVGFWYGSCLAAKRSKMVGGMCNMLPYGTCICCYAFIYFLNVFFCFCLFLFILFSNLVLINRRNGPRYQRALTLCAFSTGWYRRG